MKYRGFGVIICVLVLSLGCESTQYSGTNSTASSSNSTQDADGPVPEDLAPLEGEELLPGEREALVRIAKYRKRYGNQHKEVYEQIAKLAALNVSYGRSVRATYLLKYLVDSTSEYFGRTHVMTGISRNLLATMYLEAGELDLARQEVDKAIMILEKRAGKYAHATCKARMLEAGIDTASGEYTVARQRAREVVYHLSAMRDAKEDYARAFLLIANIDIIENDLKAAEQHCKKAVKIDADNPTSHVMLAFIHYVYGDFNVALKYTAKAKDLEKEPSYKRLLIEWIATVRLGKMDQAQAVCREFLNQKSEPAERKKGEYKLIQYFAGQATKHEAIESAAFTYPKLTDRNRAIVQLLLAVESDALAIPQDAHEHLTLASPLAENKEFWKRLYEVESERIRNRKGL